LQGVVVELFHLLIRLVQEKMCSVETNALEVPMSRSLFGRITQKTPYDVKKEEKEYATG
jgi:hypothetical protein